MTDSSSNTSTTPETLSSPSPCNHSLVFVNHAVYGFLITWQGFLIQTKYQSSKTNPFQEPSTMMLLFLTAIFTHAIALVAKIINNTWLATIIFHFSGIFACETLFWTLVIETWRWWIIINVLMLLELTLYFYKYIYVFFNNFGTRFQWKVKNCNTSSQSGISDQKADLEECSTVLETDIRDQKADKESCNTFSQEKA